MKQINNTKYKKWLLIVGSLMLLGAIILCVFIWKKKESTETADGTQITISEPVVDDSVGLGADGVFLDYADNERVIFHGYFGLFVYSLKEEQMLHAIDLEPLGCNYTQGENACEVLVSEDGEKVYLHTMSSDIMYEYDIKEQVMYQKPFSVEGIELFHKFADSSVLPEDDTVYRSEKVVIFGEGENTHYGYLYSGSGLLKDLYYVEGEKEIPLLSGKLDETNSKQQDTAEQQLSPDSATYSLSVKEGTVSKTGAVFELYNNSESEISYGESFILKRKENDNWVELPYTREDIAFIDLAYIIYPQVQAEIEVDWEEIYGELPDGIYMLEKQIGIGQGEEIPLGATFTIGEYKTNNL